MTFSSVATALKGKKAPPAPPKKRKSLTSPGPSDAEPVATQPVSSPGQEAQQPAVADAAAAAAAVNSTDDAASTQEDKVTQQDPVTQPAGSEPSVAAPAEAEPPAEPALENGGQGSSQADGANGADGAEGANGAGNTAGNGDKEPANDTEAAPKQLIATRIGRHYQEKGVTYIIDEAQYETLVPPSKASGDFDIIIKRNEEGKEMLTLTSAYLQKVYRSVVHYYPEVTIDNKTISFTVPYAPLYFYIDDMVNHVQSDQEAAAEQNKFIPMVVFYNKWVAPLHSRVRETLSQGDVIFEHLWALFRPGDLVYSADDFGQPRLYITAATTYRSGLSATNNDLGNIFPLLPNMRQAKGRFVHDCWYIDWDGSTRTFTRKSTTMVIQSFVGSRKVTSLDFYPLSYYKDGNDVEIKALCDQLTKRGHFWKELVGDNPRCLYHDGPAKQLQAGIFKVMESEKSSLSDRVIVDQSGFSIFGNEGDKALTQLNDFLGPISDAISTLINKETPVPRSEFDDLHVDFDNFPPSKDFSPLQAQLCPSTVNCCVLRSKKWYVVTVSNLKEVDWAKAAFEHLVLDDGIKSMLQGLVEQHKKNKALGRIMSDVIPTKGQGLVIVLHGPPGVGKTLTAESVAEYTQKPLYPINIGELTTEQLVVRRLEEIFTQASRWDAVLLLDEADVVLEKRSYEDIRRNGIVSVFLRMLEYYRGILFLTTNRLGTMDIAFQSRISIAIKYRELDSQLRERIWQNFIERLDNSEAEAKEQLRANLDDIKEWELNGRQIRNVLTIAQSLALAEGRRRGALRFAHVEKVATETMNFQDYFEEAYRESRARLGEITDRQFKEKKAKQMQ